ncbi:MAG TPA: hypothetical protein VHG51_07935 [Longimicrobiaceae bacterium]|nr:hypothetical protein [Longimicrobiaceae bacterium]
MSAPHPSTACRRCGRETAAGRAEAEGVCAECRAGVVRRATPVAFGVAVLVAVLYLLVLAWTGALASPNFVVFWLAVGALLAFGAYKVTRRVAFDVIRARAMRSDPG